MTGGAGRSCSPQPPTSAPLRDGGGSYGVPFPPPRTPEMHPAGTVQGNRLQRGLFLYKSIQNTVLSPPLPPRCDPTGTPPPLPRPRGKLRHGAATQWGSASKPF